MADSLIKEIGVEDLYGFLGIASGATNNEIKKAYRKKALHYHPDKNPDNPSAADMFQKLSQIYGILTDPAAKAAYDKWLRVKEMVKRKNEELSAKRRKLKETLERKESDHYTTLQAEHEARQMMKSQIERLREQNKEMVQRQQELLRNSLQDPDNDDDDENDDVIIQATWRSDGITVQQLTEKFSKYGPVQDIVVRKNKAMISFTSAHDAVNAIKDLADLFKFKWISGHPPLLTPTTLRIDDNYEEQVLERLRRAQEKKDYPKVHVDRDIDDNDDTRKRIHLTTDDQLL